MKISDFLLGWFASEIVSSWRNKRSHRQNIELYGEKLYLKQSSNTHFNQDPWGPDWDPYVVDKAYSSKILVEVYKEPDLGSFLAGYTGYFRETVAKIIADKTDIKYEEIISDLTFNLYVHTIIYLSVCSIFTHMIASSFDRMRIFGRANNLIINNFVASNFLSDSKECARLMEEKQKEFFKYVSDSEIIDIYCDKTEVITNHKGRLVRYLNEFYDPNFSSFIVDNIIPESWVFREELVKAVKSVFPDAKIHDYISWDLSNN